ncbi:DUF4232 domain-containing protein [Streptomyces corynorhini]|uniref:DUF4232 domain-containing protein n=1 Tax=Streptomyces corynorhini TaxID=2282652 RepID=A0A370B078_9ACTN|nr:DUF4232 domain-containing protein [Streptomyces corynorhini]RDG34991.1 DUF4232 domain-containing protein [Streptomyces corynorhini]
MHPRLATRSTRLALAITAAAALTATLTACDPDDTDAAASASSSSDASSDQAKNKDKDTDTDTDTDGTDKDKDATGKETGSSGSGGDRPGSSSDSTGSTGSTAGSGDTSEKEIDTDKAKQDYYGQSCGTNDLTFTVSKQSQQGGYLLVTAKARSGISCALEGIFPSVSFGSFADADSNEQAVGDTVKLSGSTVAYAGIRAKNTKDESGREFENLQLSISGDANYVTLKLPEDTLVDKPMVTNWYANSGDAIPASNMPHT